MLGIIIKLPEGWVFCIIDCINTHSCPGGVGWGFALIGASCNFVKHSLQIFTIRPEEFLMILCQCTAKKRSNSNTVLTKEATETQQIALFDISGHILYP